MPKLDITKGTTSKILRVFIQDSSSATGAGLTGLVFNSAGLTAHYSQEGDSAETAITLVTATEGTFTSSGFIEMDATDLPGFYELGIPDAALATGADSVIVMLKGATNMVPLPIEIQLTDRREISPVYLDLGFVRQSSATEVLLGPLISIVDGLPVTALTVADITAAVVKTAAPPAVPTRSSLTLTASGGSNDFVHVGDGYWRLEVTTSNTDTLGDIDLTLRDDDLFMPVHARGHVVSTNVYDSLIADSDTLETDMIRLNGGLTSGNNATLSLAKLDINNSSGMAVEIDGVPASGEGVVDIRSATNATYALLLRNTATGSTSNALRIQNAATGGAPASDDAALFIGAQGADAPGISMSTAGGVSSAISVVNASEFSDSNIPANLKAVNDDTANIANVENLFNGTGYDIGQGVAISADVQEVAGSSANATDLARAADAITSFLVVAPGSGAPTTSAFDCDSTEATDDHYNGGTVTFISGVLDGQSATITDYDGTNKRLTVSTMTDAPSNNDRFVIR